MRLLIIDDDIELCQLVADYLKPMGFEVEMEHEGERGAERAASETWSAIILDVMMPGCDGFEVLRRIRAKSKVPVMMLTGRGEEVDRLIRATERVVLPLIGDGVNAADLVAFNGNFGICNASPGESWVTDGSWCPKTNTGELNLARVKWRKANALVKG